MSAWVYDALLRALFVVHAVLAAYVAGGTAWLAVRGARGVVAADHRDPIPVDNVADGLRDWLPFVLGLAITFGVGPLLFVQLTDGSAFYTANLLLSHRFMAVLPALVAGFYLLYVQKTRWRWVRSRAGRFTVPTAAMACFAFTAWSWSENHLLAQSASMWPAVYAAGPGFFAHADLPWRLAVFAGVALQAVAVLLPMQRPALGTEARAARQLAVAGVAGVAVVLVALALHPAVAGVSLISPTGALLLVAELGLASLWFTAARRGRAPALLPTALGIVVAVERVASLREAVRVARGGADQLADNASTQGFGTFAAALVLVVAAIAWSIARVRRDLAVR